MRLGCIQNDCMTLSIILCFCFLTMSLCIYNKAKPFNLSLDIEFRIHVKIYI